MKKVFKNNSQVIEKWREQSQSEGRANNLFFEGKTIFSYGRHYPLATIYDNCTLINSKNYSVATQHHKSMVYYFITTQRYQSPLSFYVNNKKVFYVPCTYDCKDKNNLLYLKSEVKKIHKLFKKCLPLNKEYHYKNTIEAINNYRLFLNYFYNKNKSILKENEFTLKMLEHNKNLFITERENRRIEGVLIPKNLFKHYKNNTITPDMILKCRNAEVRSILLKTYGYGRLINHYKHTIIDTDKIKDYELIKLYIPKTQDVINWQGEIIQRLPEDIMLIKVKDTSTGTFYVLRVPLTVKTCREALAWTFNMSENEYILEQEA